MAWPSKPLSYSIHYQPYYHSPNTPLAFSNVYILAHHFCDVKWHTSEVTGYITNFLAGNVLTKGVFTLDPDCNLHWLNRDQIRTGCVHIFEIRGNTWYTWSIEVWKCLLWMWSLLLLCSSGWSTFECVGNIKGRRFAHIRGGFGPPHRGRLECRPGPVHWSIF